MGTNVLALWTEGPHPMGIHKFSKWAAASGLGWSPAANSVNDPSHTCRIVSAQHCSKRYLLFGLNILLRPTNLSSDAVTLHRGTTIGKFYTLPEWNAEFYKISPESNKHSLNQFRVEQSAAELLEIDVRHGGTSKWALEDLLQEFSDVFSTGKQDLGQTDWVYYTILRHENAVFSRSLGSTSTCRKLLHMSHVENPLGMRQWIQEIIHPRQRVGVLPCMW